MTINRRAGCSRRAAACTFLAALGLLSARPAFADAFPSKPIHLIATAAPGGASDIIARRLAKVIEAQSGANIVVENKAGASGSIGLVATIRAPKDGYTVVIAVPDAVTIYPLMKKVRPYEGEKDLSPIAQVGETHFIFAVNAANSANTLREFVNNIKRKPGSRPSFASAGNGTTGRLVTEMLMQQTGIEMVHVPYRSSAPALLGVAGGEAEIMATSVASAKALVDGGRVKMIGVTRDTKMPGFEGIPTVVESGLPGLVVPVWWGVFGPPNLPADVHEKLATLFLNAINSDEMRAQLATLGLEARPRGPAEFAAFLRKDTQMWQDVIRKSNIPPED